MDEFGFVLDGRLGVGAGDVQDDAAVDFAGVHAREDVVDVFDLLCLGRGRGPYPLRRTIELRPDPDACPRWSREW